VPAGARISAGKLGSVARSFPNAAASDVNRSPVSCIPSPESPANLITTRSSLVTFVARPPPLTLVLIALLVPLSHDYVHCS
jgi:hypothetical protein